MSNNNQRKLLMHDDRLTFVATSDLSGDIAQGTITVFESNDAGEHWTGMHLLNDIDVWRDEGDVGWDPQEPDPEKQDVNRWRPSIVDSGATSPAITRIEDSWGVVWQRIEGSGYSRLFFSAPGASRVDLAGGSIARANDTLTPVIAWGRYSPVDSANILKVVYCTDDGLAEVVSTDGGTSFDSPSLIAGTSAASIHPSLAMSVDHEILVYEESEEIFGIIDGATAMNLSAMHPEFLRNMSPSVTLTGSTAHVVWTAEVYEYIPQYDREDYHIKPSHKVFDFEAVPDSNVASFLNIKYGRLEEARYPVIATKYAQGNPFEAVLMWSVSDTEEGVRLRYNEFAWNPSSDRYQWAAKSTESALSTQPTYHPAIAGDDGEVRFVVTRGEDIPYRIECAAPSPLVPDPFVGESEVLIHVLDLIDSTWQDRVRMEDVIHFSEGGVVIGRAGNAGVPFAGFDGSHDGPPLAVLSLSEEILLHEQDALSWTLHVHRMPTNHFFDTTAFRVDMYDALDSTVIAGSSTILIPFDKLDTTFTVALQLPPSHYPAAPVRLSLGVSGDAHDNGMRYYTATKHIYTTSDVRKRSHRNHEPAAVAAEAPSIEVFPQPAGTTLQLIHRMEAFARAIVTLHDHLGRLLRRVAAVADGSGVLRMRLDVADLRSGMYDCRISTNGRSTRRMVSIVR
jgi:hypothetical protein